MPRRRRYTSCMGKGRAGKKVEAVDLSSLLGHVVRRAEKQTGPRIVLKRSGGWWAASMPAFPGAYSQGRTQAEARENLWDAVVELAKAERQLARQARQASRHHKHAVA